MSERGRRERWKKKQIDRFNDLRAQLMKVRDDIFITLEEAGHELQTMECHELDQAVDQMAEYLDDVALELDANKW